LEQVSQAIQPGGVGTSQVEGFQKGMERGYQEGYASGLQVAREAGHAEGHREGLRQGLEQGYVEARAAFDRLSAPIDAVLASLRAQQDEYQTVLRKEVIDLVAKVARQVIRCELALQPVQMLALVDETLATMPPAPKGVEVFLNPGDLQRIRELAPERLQDWALIDDPRLESGECRVKAGHQEADAGCSQRLAACMGQISAQLLESGHKAVDAPHVQDAPAATPLRAAVAKKPRARRTVATAGTAESVEDSQ
jgi:flagellar assembly protein FliH